MNLLIDKKNFEEILKFGLKSDKNRKMIINLSVLIISAMNLAKQKLSKKELEKIT